MEKKKFFKATINPEINEFLEKNNFNKNSLINRLLKEYINKEKKKLQ